MCNIFGQTLLELNMQFIKNVIKKIINEIIIRIPLMRYASNVFIIHRKLLPELFVSTSSAELREILRLPCSEHYTQLNQDIFALLINRFKKGYFVEIGANDGYTLSNTVYLEEYFDWDGLLIEANPKYINNLMRRNAKVCSNAVAKEEGYIEFIDAGLYGGIVSTMDSTHMSHTKLKSKIHVKSQSLEKIFKEFDVPNRIDFLSLDVEGGEKEILKQLCELKTYRVTSGVVEHNFRSDDFLYFKQILEKAEYEVVWCDRTKHDLFFVDKNYLR